MKKIGYARVASLDGDNLEMQIAALRDTGCETVFREIISGLVIDRPQFNAALRSMKPGDELVIVKLDRLGRDFDLVGKSLDMIAACDATASALDGSIDVYRSMIRT